GVITPIRKDLDVKLAYTADVLPNQQVAIFSKVSGYIKRLGADLGDFVKEGQLVVEVEAPELAAAVEQARAAVATAVGNLQVAAARSQIETQRSQVALAQSNADGARAFLKIAQTNLDNTRILAPFSGYISARNLYPGASVNSQQAGTSTQAVGILVLQDIATVKAQLEVQERHITLVRLGSVARVLVDAYPDRAFDARATRLAHAPHPRTP